MGNSLAGVKGTVEGTGASISVDVGFRPEWVILMNVDGKAILHWTDDMGDGKGMKTVDSGTGTTDISYITTGGITQSDPDDDSFDGFKIGTDSDLNVSAETLMYICGR